MARYIDADALIKEMKECKYANPCNDYQRGVNASIDIHIVGIKHMPSADVVPRSEAAREIIDDLASEGLLNVEPWCIANLKKKYTEGGNVAYGGPREGGKRFAEKQFLLYRLKREVHDKAVRPHNAGIDAYISLKVFDAILQGYLNKL